LKTSRTLGVPVYTVTPNMALEKPRFTPQLLHPKHWPMWLLIGLWWLLAQLPYGIQRGLARVLAALLKRFAKARQHIARRNIALCFPNLSETERETLLNANMQSMAMALFETGMAWFWTQNRLRKRFNIEGLEHLQREDEQGTVLMAMHFSTLEIGAAFLNLSTIVDGMYRPHKNPVYDYVQRRGRERHNPNCEVLTRDDVRGMLRRLKRGRAVWYAPDQDYGRKQSVFAPFFGIEAASVTATARFATIAKAKVVPFVQTRLDNGHYQVTIYPPLEDFPNGDERDNASAINRFIEERILEQPEQYMWVHRRFKTRPTGQPSLYK